MNRRLVTGEPSRPMYHQCRLIEGKPCESPKENACTHSTNQKKELTAQCIVVIMGVVVALLSSLCMLTVWYLGAVSIQNIRAVNPV